MLYYIVLYGSVFGLVLLSIGIGVGLDCELVIGDRQTGKRFMYVCIGFVVRCVS